MRIRHPSGTSATFEESTFALREVPHAAQICGLAQSILAQQEPTRFWLPPEGDPTRRPDDKYDQVYYTYHALAALLDVGLPIGSLPIRSSLQAFAEAFPGVSLNYRPMYYLLVPLEMLEGHEVAMFVELLRRRQIGHGSPFAGSFLFPQGWLDDDGPEAVHWQPNYHVGGVYFHALHLGFLLSEIIRLRYEPAAAAAAEVLEGVRGMLNRTLSESGGYIPYASGSMSPDLTTWAVLLRARLRLVFPSDTDHVVIGSMTKFKAETQVARRMLLMNVARLLGSEAQLGPEARNAAQAHIQAATSALDQDYYVDRHNPRNASIALRTHLAIGDALETDYRLRLRATLIQYFSEGMLLPEDVEDWT